MLTAAVLVPNLAYHAEINRSSNILADPFLIIERKPTHITVMDFTPSLPIQAGMELEKALAKIPKVCLIDADILYYNKIWNELLDIFHLYSPSIESERLGLAYVDLIDQDQISKENISSLISKKQLPHNLPIQIGIGKNKYLAYITARQAKAGYPAMTPDNVKGFLAPLSIDHLPISPKSHSALREFGLHTLGDITRYPLGPFQAQFGNEGRLIWNLAHGNDNRPIINRVQQEIITEKMSFVSPMQILSSIMIAIETLLKRVFTHPTLRRRSVLQMSFQANAGQELWTKNILFRPAQKTWTTCLHIIGRKLERESFPGALEDLQIIASGLTEELGHQGSLFSDYRKKEQLGELIKTLEVQFGPRPQLWQVREIEPWSRIPERRMALIPFVP